MTHQPTVIKLGDIAEVIAREFPARDMLTVYVGSNAATPTASLDAITDALKAGWPKLPYLRMVHLLLQGPLSYVEEGLQDRIMAFSIFSGSNVRKAANEGRAFYLPCTLANMDSLIGKDKPYMPDVAIFKVRLHEVTGEYSLGLSVEALHTAIDHAKCVIAELDMGMPFTQGQSVVDASSLDYLVEDDIRPVYETPAPDFDHMPPAERRIGELIATHFIRDGVTLQVGIGQIPDAVIGTRVLVVDDNEDAADSLATLLEVMNYDVRVAYDGPEAIEAADEATLSTACAARNAATQSTRLFESRAFANNGATAARSEPPTASRGTPTASARLAVATALSAPSARARALMAYCHATALAGSVDNTRLTSGSASRGAPRSTASRARTSRKFALVGKCAAASSAIRCDETVSCAPFEAKSWRS